MRCSTGVLKSGSRTAEAGPVLLSIDRYQRLPSAWRRGSPQVQRASDRFLWTVTSAMQEAGDSSGTAKDPGSGAVDALPSPRARRAEVRPRGLELVARADLHAHSPVAGLLEDTQAHPQPQQRPSRACKEQVIEVLLTGSRRDVYVEALNRSIGELGDDWQEAMSGDTVCEGRRMLATRLRTQGAAGGFFL